MGSLPHNTPAADAPDGRAIESPAELLEVVRRNCLSWDPEIVERINRALDRTDDDHDLGSLFIARALALQGRGNASAPAAAARNAVPHLVAAGKMQTAAFASAMAAVLLDQSGEPISAMEHAVDSLVMLGDLGTAPAEGQLEHDGVRAALALSGFFLRLSAFDLAVDAAARAFQSGRLIENVTIDPLAYSAGYVAVEGAHATEDDAMRHKYIDQAMVTIEWLEAHGVDVVSRTMLANGLRGEARHALGHSSSDLDLDGAADLYDSTAPDLVAWHQLVRGTSAHLRGDPAAAIARFSEAIPGLEASSDNHCLVRALRGRAAARAQAGDLEGAYADAADLAGRTRRWQISQVSRLAFQLTRRADLERSTTELQRTAARLAADIDSDATTGVNSRRWLERRLDELAATDGFGSTLMCDIDHFKSVNDTYGHHVGDDVLREFGRLLHQVAENAEIARFGGEEFVVVLANHDEAGGLDVAERIRSAVEHNDWTDTAPGLHLTISCGITHGPLSNIRGLLIAADYALLEAKNRGRNVVMTPFGSAPD